MNNCSATYYVVHKYIKIIQMFRIKTYENRPNSKTSQWLDDEYY